MAATATTAAFGAQARASDRRNGPRRVPAPQRTAPEDGKGRGRIGGSRPDRLADVRPQERVLPHTVEQSGDVALGLPALDALVP